MNYFTLNPNEFKREIKNFCTNLTQDVSKKGKRLFFEITYGMAREKSCYLSDIARAIGNNVKLANTIDRLSTNLSEFDKRAMEKIDKRFNEKIKAVLPEEDPIAILDDSDMIKRYSYKLEDLDIVIDASSPNKEKLPGYHICESIILTKREKQPLSVYSKIYSCVSDSFKSKKNYTYESIDKIREVMEGKEVTFVADRLYDDQEIYKYIEAKGDKFVIRLDDRNLLFKGKKKNIKEVAKSRKGKIRMDLEFEDEKITCYISYTRATLPSNKKEYNFVMVYGLSEKEPLMILTNREINSTSDLRRIVRIYFSRWRIEEYFRAKKQEYKFEKMLLRTLDSMNNLNTILRYLIGYLMIIADNINIKLLGIKLVYASQSLREKVVVWFSQLARGLSRTLREARTGISELMEHNNRPKTGDTKQLQLQI